MSTKDQHTSESMAKARSEGQLPPFTTLCRDQILEEQEVSRGRYLQTHIRGFSARFRSEHVELG